MDHQCVMNISTLTSNLDQIKGAMWITKNVFQYSKHPHTLLLFIFSKMPRFIDDKNFCGLLALEKENRIQNQILETMEIFL